MNLCLLEKVHRKFSSKPIIKIRVLIPPPGVKTRKTKWERNKKPFSKLLTIQKVSQQKSQCHAWRSFSISSDFRVFRAAKRSAQLITNAKRKGNSWNSDTKEELGSPRAWANQIQDTSKGTPVWRGQANFRWRTCFKGIPRERALN